MQLIHRVVSWVLGRNTQYTPKDVILAQLTEPRPLPLGMTEFEEWSDRIISGAALSATPESLKFALAEMIMHLKPQQDHCEDGYFIKSLRKSAANQIAYAKMEALRADAKARLAREAEIKAVPEMAPVVGRIAAHAPETKK